MAVAGTIPAIAVGSEPRGRSKISRSGAYAGRVPGNLFYSIHQVVYPKLDGSTSSSNNRGLSVESKSEERRLTTILSADVVGYSRLMAADESGTLAQLRAHRKELIEPKTAEYRGRVVKLMGDGSLMEFGSVVDAVLFAVEVQRAMAARNADIPEDRRITYRIGINIGDIIVVGDDIYGDGVNVAARLQSIAEPGGICISRSVYNEVRNKVEFGFNNMGEQSLKNIPEPVSTYKVWWGKEPPPPAAAETPVKTRSLKWPVVGSIVALLAIGGVASWFFLQPESAPPIEAAVLERMAFPLPEKPSVAVQPFEGSETDGGDPFLANGFVYAVTAELIRGPSLFVIGQHSSMSNRFRGSKAREMAEQLGVRYVLMGTFTRNLNDVVVDTRLIDAIDARQLWRQTEEGKIGELHRIQSKVVDVVRESLVDAAQSDGGAVGGRRLAQHGESYAKLLQGIGHFQNSTPADNERAAQLIAEAISLEPDSAIVHAWFAWNDIFGVMMEWTDEPAARMQRAFASARKAVSLDPSLSFSRWAFGAALMTAGDHPNAAAQIRAALKLSPEDPDLLAGAAKTMAFAGAAPEAVAFGKGALRHNPRPPDWYRWSVGIANYFAGNHEDAIASLERSVSKSLEARLFLIASYIRSDRGPDADLQAEEIFQADPSFHVARYMDRTVFANDDDRQSLTADLFAAGLPENVSFTCMLEPTVENCR